MTRRIESAAGHDPAIPRGIEKGATMKLYEEYRDLVLYIGPGFHTDTMSFDHE